LLAIDRDGTPRQLHTGPATIRDMGAPKSFRVSSEGLQLLLALVAGHILGARGPTTPGGTTGERHCSRRIEQTGKHQRFGMHSSGRHPEPIRSCTNSAHPLAVQSVPNGMLANAVLIG